MNKSNYCVLINYSYFWKYICKLQQKYDIKRPLAQEQTPQHTSYYILLLWSNMCLYSEDSFICVVSSSLGSSCSAPVSLLLSATAANPFPLRLHILALHKFLMTMLKSPVTSTHTASNCHSKQTVQQTHVWVARLRHTQDSEAPSWRCWRPSSTWWQLQCWETLVVIIVIIIVRVLLLLYSMLWIIRDILNFAKE